MTHNTSSATPVVITRIFDAPRERVWRAWTEPEHLMKWWGPQGFTSPTATIDLRVGGKYVFGMRSPEGQDMWSSGFFREIVPMERLVATDSFSDADGNIISPTEYGMSADTPDAFLMTITFEDVEGGKTKMTITHEGMPDGEMREMSIQGLNESFDKLEASLR